MPALHIVGLKTYRTIAARRRPTVDWVLRGLEQAGCRIIAEPDLSRAPFLFAIHAPGVGDLKICGYICTSTSRETRKRPQDEARFQMKFGGKEPDNLHTLLDDPSWTTLLLGVDVEHALAVSADPWAHSPTKFYISVEYKHQNMSAVGRLGWHAWERERRDHDRYSRPISTERPATTETLVGLRQERLLDLVLFERAARGLTPEYRHVLADSWSVNRGSGKIASSIAPESHALIEMLGMSPTEIMSMITEAPRLLMAVRGWTAQRHLHRAILGLPGIERASPIEKDGQPDLEVWTAADHGVSRQVLVECKNSLREPDGRGRPRVDFQRTRAPKGNPCGRYYEAREFDILAACLHPITQRWEFMFKPTSRMAGHKTCDGRLDHRVVVDDSWTPDLAAAIAAI